MKILLNLFFVLFFVLIPVSNLFPLDIIKPVSAQISICDLAPFLKGVNGLGVSVCTPDGEFNTDLESSNSTAAESAGSFVRFGLSLVFVGVIAFAIYTIIRSAIKYIQSEGDSEKVEEAQKAIRSVFMGLGALFVGIIGIIIIIIIFGASGSLNVENTTNSDTLNSFLGGLKNDKSSDNGGGNK